MRFVVAVVACLALASVASAVFITEHEYNAEFAKFVKDYNKRYSADEFFDRFNRFKIEYERVVNHNADTSHSWQMGINQFSDRALNEIVSADIHPARQRPHVQRHSSRAVVGGQKAQPTEVDWRLKGVVTAIKNQLPCSGAGYAFAAAAAVESAWAIVNSNRSLIALSEQQLLDCSGREGNQACDGGLVDNALQFVMDNKGICSEAAYPYNGTLQRCMSAACASVANISNFADFASGAEDQIYERLAIQPVAVTIEAGGDFPYYHGGIFRGDCGRALFHAVLIVGYGVDAQSNTPYWILKNSYGEAWGEKGYMRIIRGTNQCALAEAASYPIIL